MRFLLFLIPIFLFATEERLAQCYNKGLGKDSCGKELAYFYLDNKREIDAGEIFLDLTIKGDMDAMRELSLLYIYGNEMPRDCMKGVSMLLNSALENPAAYLEIAKLFETGTCEKKDLAKAEKYKKIYLEKSKELLKNKELK